MPEARRVRSGLATWIGCRDAREAAFYPGERLVILVEDDPRHLANEDAVAAKSVVMAHLAGDAGGRVDRGPQRSSQMPSAVAPFARGARNADAP